MKPLVIYHANCWDGFCAAWVARRAMDDIEAIPVQYGTPPPDVTGRHAFVLDFSYPRNVMTKMKAQAESLRVFDHHKTAETELSGLEFCTFDMNKSGARLTWEYFFGEMESSWLVNYTEDRDLWRHALEDSEAINAALRSYPLAFHLWDGFAQQHPADFTREGEAIRRREKQIVIEHVRNARDVDMAGHRVLVANATVMYSEIAGELAKGRPFGAVYFDRHDGKRQWSLRSAPDGVDVSAIAKHNGGGGHEHAAGYEEFAAGGGGK